MMTYAVHAQSQLISVSGKVTDSNTSEFIPFAHIFIQGTSIGTTTNLYGNFSLDVPSSLLSQELQVTCLGYKSTSFIFGESPQPILIKLEEDIIQLEEVVVKPETAENLMKEALLRIPDNYDTTARKHSGYYKMTSMLGNKTSNYIEAFLDIVKPSMSEIRRSKKGRKDSTRFREVRTIPSEVKDWKLKAMIDWESTPRQIENRDIVKQFMTEEKVYNEFMSLFDFQLENMVYIDGRRTYKINLAPKKNKRKAYWNGSIFLDEETKAFVKIDFVSTDNMFRTLKGQLNYKLMSSLYKVKYDQGEWKERISYKLTGDKWYFDEVNSSKQFLISSKKRSLSEVPVNVTVEYHTDSIRGNYVAPDSIIFLPYSKNWWENAEYIESLYDSVFWNEFDGGKRLEISSKESLEENNLDRSLGYQFTKLDTLQGTLTSLRTSYDVGFYHLDIEVLPEEEILKGSSLIRFKVVEPTNRIQVDLFSEMAIEKIEWRGQQLKFEREYNAVYVYFPKTLTKGSVDEIKVFYSGRPVDYDPAIPMYASFLWLEDDNGNPLIQAICQGYGASGWWPNKDHLSDEPDSAKVTVTVPADLEVISNGRLMNKTELDNKKTRFDWAVSYPINNYNITFNIGRYKHTTDQYVNGTSKLDLDYYMLQENDTDISVTTAIVKPMLKTFEKYFGPYPFPNDGFKLVESPHAMEHQSCVAIHSGYFYDADDSGIWSDMPADDIIYSIVLHESAHEWWGNSVSCTDNAELWLHEAFATYAEALFVEDHYGYAASQKYLNRMKKQVKNQMAIIGKPNVNHIHYEIGDMYTKGALTLNTLRNVIANDDLWFFILKGLQTEFRHQSITTLKLIAFVNKVTKTDYSYFFDQYLRYTDIPKLEMTYQEIEDKTYFKYRWLADVEGFAMPIKYAMADGDWEKIYPTNHWKQLQISDEHIDKISVNTEQFYVDTLVR